MARGERGSTRARKPGRVHRKLKRERNCGLQVVWFCSADSQTKCHTDDVWREGKKKGLEGGEGWPEGGDEVSATQWGRTKRAGGVAAGGAEAGGDRAGAWAPPQYGVARTEAQRGALRRLVSRATGAAAGARTALSVAAQQPVWAPALGTSGRVVEGTMEPRTSLRALALGARTGDQPRDDLSSHLAGSEKWRHAPRTSARVRARAAGNATGATTAAGASRANE